MVKTEDEIPPDVGINEFSGLTDEMTEIDEARSESMTYRPVWVRSRPIFRFPVEMLHYSAGVRPTGLPIRLAGTGEMSPVWDNELGCVPTDHS